ncbi:MAG: hypothetical protein MZV65_47835 [Chromatiales bacterium]|nr:hypothetical protein [Chromatiales bacterium]
MPRRPRLALAGVATHIIQRGNNRGACFFADEDLRALPAPSGGTRPLVRLRGACLRADDQPRASAGRRRRRQTAPRCL